MARETRFWTAMGAFALLGVLEWSTLSAETIRVIDGPNGQPLLEISMRGVGLGMLILFAFRSWIHHRREMLEQSQQAKDGLAGDTEERGRSGQE